jgi:hypothetical protein
VASKTLDKARNGEGRQQRKNSPTGKLRAPDLNDYYGKKLRDVIAGDFHFRTILVRPEKQGNAKTLILDRAVTSIEWTEEGSTLTGSLQLKRPAPHAVEALPIKERHLIRLLVRWGGEWYRLWEMRVEGDPEPVGSSGDLSVSLGDDLAALRKNVREWEFKKDKHHPDGWSPEAIAAFVGRKEGVKLGRIAKGRARIKKLKMKGSGLEVILRAYAQERRKTDRKFVVRLRDGELDILPFERHKVLYQIKGVALDYSTQTSPLKKRPTTVIEAKGRVGRKKIEAKIFRKAALKRIGLSAEEKSYGKVDSRKELIEEAQRDLAEELRVKRTASLQIPGIPFIQRGDTVHWITNEPGWSGPGHGTQDRGFGYVTAVTHTASPANFESSVTLSQVDPYLEDARSRAKRERDEKKGSRDKRRNE